MTSTDTTLRRPRQLAAWRQRQIASAGVPFTEPLVITDDEIRETIAHGQLRLQTERGTDLTLFSDTCVYHYPGVRLLVEVIGADNVVFASEMIGAVKGVDARSGHFFDDTRRYVDAIEGLSQADRSKFYEGNALKIYPRLARNIASPG